jgi:hypothetical protein
LDFSAAVVFSGVLSRFLPCEGGVAVREASEAGEPGENRGEEQEGKIQNKF